jgi:hypothetical protein
MIQKNTVISGTLLSIWRPATADDLVTQRD